MGLHFFALPIIAAAVIQWVIGALWYGVAFRKRWMALVGTMPDARPGRAGFEMAASFVLDVVIAYVLANVISGLGHLLWGGAPSFQVGMSIAVMCWFGFVAPPMLTQSLFERKPVNLFALNAGYWIFSMAISGGVLAVLLK